MRLTERTVASARGIRVRTPDPQFFCQGDQVDVWWVRWYVGDLNERLLCCVVCSTRGGCRYSTARWRWLPGSASKWDDDASETRRGVSLSHHVRHVLWRHRLITASVSSLPPAAAAAAVSVVKWSQRHIPYIAVLQWTSGSWFYTFRCVFKDFCDFASPQATNLSKSWNFSECNGCLSLLFGVILWLATKKAHNQQQFVKSYTSYITLDVCLPASYCCCYYYSLLHTTYTELTNCPINSGPAVL